MPVPVSDIDRAKKFYVEQAGFRLDVDYAPRPGFRVVQLTPPGSACSIQLGDGAVCLVVTDLLAACEELTARGLEVGPIRHKASIEDWQGDWAPGVDPGRRDYA